MRRAGGEGGRGRKPQKSVVDGDRFRVVDGERGD
jgi:hypothetical protein